MALERTAETIRISVKKSEGADIRRILADVIVNTREKGIALPVSVWAFSEDKLDVTFTDLGLNLIIEFNNE